MNGHGAVLSVQLQRSFQETVTSVTRVTTDSQHEVGCLRLNGELLILGIDLQEKEKEALTSFEGNIFTKKFKKRGENCNFFQLQRQEHKLKSSHLLNYMIMYQANIK